jgi:hypothetical protein
VGVSPTFGNYRWQAGRLPYFVKGHPPPDQKTTHTLRVLIFSHPKKPFPYARLGGMAFA